MPSEMNRNLGCVWIQNSQNPKRPALYEPLCSVKNNGLHMRYIITSIIWMQERKNFTSSRHFSHCARGVCLHTNRIIHCELLWINQLATHIFNSNNTFIHFYSVVLGAGVYREIYARFNKKWINNETEKQKSKIMYFVMWNHHCSFDAFIFSKIYKFYTIHVTSIKWYMQNVVEFGRRHFCRGSPTNMAGRLAGQFVRGAINLCNFSNVLFVIFYYGFLNGITIFHRHSLLTMQNACDVLAGRVSIDTKRSIKKKKIHIFFVFIGY